MDQVSKIEQALARFETAISQLESSMVAVHAQNSDLTSAQGEADALRAEHEKMTAELGDVRARADELSDVARQAVKRIDMAMDRIKNVVG